MKKPANNRKGSATPRKRSSIPRNGSTDTQHIRHKDVVQKSNDEHIDQDFPGFPHHPSKKETIKNGADKNPHFKDEETSDGSASAFDSADSLDYNSSTDNDNDDFDEQRRRDK